MEGKGESQSRSRVKLDWIASAQTSEGRPLTPKKNMDIVIYQKLETGTELEHDRKHEKKKTNCHILLHVRCSLFFFLSFTTEGGKKEWGRERLG